MWMWMWILIGLDIITKVLNYSHGNNPESCNTLLPQHKNHSGSLFTTQDSAPPFEVDYEPNRNPGDPITVVLRSNNSTRFRGFMLEAREADSGQPVGKFILLEPDRTHLLMCNGLADSAVCQSDNLKKDLIRVNWTTAEINQDIVFRATFLQSFETFWENVNSTFRLPTTVPEPSTTTNTPASSTTSKPPPKPGLTFAEVSTTTNTPASSNTATTTKQSTTKSSNVTSTVANSTLSSTKSNNNNIVVRRLNTEERVGAALMCVDCLLGEAKMEMSNAFAVLLAKGTHYHRLGEIGMNTLCFGFEIASLVLLCAGGYNHLILICLACVVILISILEKVIWPLTISDILSEQIGGIAVKGGFVVHLCFSLSIPYVAVWIDYGKKWIERWPLKVLIAFTVWICLAVVWTLVFNTQKKAIRRTVEQVALSSDGRCSPQSQKKNLLATKVTVIAVLVFVVFGATCLAIAVIVGIAGSQEN